MGIRHKATFGDFDGYYFPTITIALKYIQDPMSPFYSPHK